MKIIIFDFDGVLADSFDAYYSAVKEAFASESITLTEEEYRNFYLKNVKLAEKEKINDDEKFDQVQRLIKEKVPVYYKRVILFAFVPDLVRKLYSRCDLAIISSTAQNTLKNKLKAYDLQDLFKLILGADKELSKKKKIMTVLKNLNCPPNKALFVSDTVGDIKEGLELGLKTAAVTWGFHDKKLLSQAGPDFIVNNQDELLNIL